MNIHTLSAHNSSSLASVLERGLGTSGARGMNASADGDVVSLRAPARLLDDADVESTLSQTRGMIVGNPLEAMAVHGGLDASRVAALLA